MQYYRGEFFGAILLLSRDGVNSPLLTLGCLLAPLNEENDKEELGETFCSVTVGKDEALDLVGPEKDGIGETSTILFSDIDSSTLFFLNFLRRSGEGEVSLTNFG